MLQEGNYGDQGLYLLDDTRLTNDYSGNHLIASAYAAANLPFERFNIFAGVRFEHSRMTLESNLSDYEHRTAKRHYDGNDFFPSLNTVWKVNERHQLRLSYGRPTYYKILKS